LYYTPNGPRSAFLRYAVGARLPAHAHVGYEHIIVLSGSQSDHSGLHGPGAMIINPPGTSHAVYSAIGCLVLAIWEKPVVFGANETAEE
jgi:anti-sigma factor ChrR (cupin superfamily)